MLKIAVKFAIEFAGDGLISNIGVNNWQILDPGAAVVMIKWKSVSS